MLDQISRQRGQRSTWLPDQRYSIVTVRPST
jgi:hypothetical protein